jgi:hypothetical protein
MKKFQLPLILILILITASCDKEKDNKTNLSLDKVSGYVQKGPYLNGTAITISELSTDLIPTGKNFSSQILDNKGTFEVKNVELSSQYVELKADGFYFNEITNSNSTAQLTLYTLSDLTNKASLNVNVLSNLEKSRVEYLIANGYNFSNAKKQAQAEILKIFEMKETDMTESELLDITKSGDDNAMLLAVSLILQGYLSVSDLSELLANISTDIREDGFLNSQVLGSTLLNNAKTIKLDKIRENLEKRYETLGLEVTFSDFEKYVTQFIDSTDFEFTGGIKYPATGNFGINILDKEKTEYASGTYSMKAILPEGTSLKVKILGEFHWYYPAFQTDTGWNPSEWNNDDNSRTFTSTRTGEIDFEMMLESFQNDSITTYTNKIDIEIYENDADNPTWEKEINIK